MLDVKRDLPRDLAELLFRNVTGPNSLNDLLVEGKKKFWSPTLLDFNGVLEDELDTPTMVYRPIEDSQVYIPDWVQERLNWVTDNFDVKQVIIGEEKEEPMSAEAEAARQTIAIGKVLLIAVAGVAIAAALGTMLIAVAAVVLGLLAVGAALAGLAVIDPQLVVILENDPKERWICVAEWLHGSSQ